jgi:hypothetical protein
MNDLVKQMKKEFDEFRMPPWAQKMSMGFMMGASAGMTVGTL